MKVIAEDHNLIKDWKAEMKCTGNGNSSDNQKAVVSPCGATLEIGVDDVFVTTKKSFYSDYRESFETTESRLTIKCCECGSLTDLEKDTPAAVVLYAKQNSVQKAGAVLYK